MTIYRELTIYDETQRITHVPDRIGHLAATCQQKQVLHVGCSDWPITGERVRADKLLHKFITEASRSCLGIDLSEGGVHSLRSAGFENVRIMDAEEMPFENEFDVVVAGDVLEHMNNPGLFLAGAVRALRPGGTIVIAVPSALTFGNVKAWLQQKEQVHKDHTFYYSPKTLATLCGRYNLLPTKLYFTVQPAGAGESKLFLFARSLILKLFPNSAPAIIMHFQKEQDIQHRDLTVTLP